MPIILPEAAKKARKKSRKLGVVRTPRSSEKNYRDSLKDITKGLTDALQPIVQLLGSGAASFLVLEALDKQIDTTTAAVGIIAPTLSDAFVSDVGTVSKKRLESIYKEAFSVDSAKIIDSVNVTGAMDASIVQNVGLIKTIPQKFWSDVVQAVTANYTGEPQVGGVSLMQRLTDIGGVSDSRAKFIARDQTAKLNADLTKLRHQDIGVIKYLWRNAQDERVVGNPAGLYPKGTRGHGNHWEREGKTYYYDRPPGDGNPGRAYNCRCYAEPIIDLDNMNVIYS